MKTIDVRNLPKSAQSALETVQDDQVVITRDGDSIAVVIGVEGVDWKTVTVETSRSFWKEITKRRSQQTISLAEIRKCVGA